MIPAMARQMRTTIRLVRDDQGGDVIAGGEVRVTGIPF
jgi:hypothetical protein